MKSGIYPNNKLEIAVTMHFEILQDTVIMNLRSQ